MTDNKSPGGNPIRSICHLSLVIGHFGGLATLPKPCPLPLDPLAPRLQGVLSCFPGSDAHGLREIGDKDFTVSDLAGSRSPQDRIDGIPDPVVGHNNFNFD